MSLKYEPSSDLVGGVGDDVLAEGQERPEQVAGNMQKALHRSLSGHPPAKVPPPPPIRVN